MNNDEVKLLTGAQAAEFLGVKSATLYAYASRGLIESLPARNGRERAYRLSDLIRLRQSARGFKSARDSEPAAWTGPVIKSSITDIGANGHSYRGQNVIPLAQKQTPFEEVAEILWETDGEPAHWQMTKPFKLPRPIKHCASQDTDYLDLLKLLLVGLEMSDTVNRQLVSVDIFQISRRLIVTMAASLGVVAQRDAYLSDSRYPIAQTILHGLSGKRSREQAQLVNQVLVLCADHELNASALATRIAASCDAPLYSCLLSAMGTFSGSLHGSAARRTEDIIATSMKFQTAAGWLKDFLKQSQTVPGFGTELYEQGDPRARLLLDAAAQLGSKSAQLKRLFEIVECVQSQLGLHPNLDVGLAAVSYALALPTGAGSSIFAISRTAGWIAHAHEQRLYGGIIRPRARYIGR